MAAITDALEDDGWAVVRSNVLDGAELLFVRDEAVAVPAEVAGLPRFDRAELEVLVAQRPDGETLRAIVMAKEQIPGSRMVRAEPCPTCRGSTTWYRAGDGWTCAACHPPVAAGRGAA